MVLIYLIYYKPFEKQEMNNIEAFNEICILVCSYHLLLFTDFVTDTDIQDLAGFSLIGITGLNVGTNTLIMAVKTYQKARLGIKKLVYKYKMLKQSRDMKRIQKYIEPEPNSGGDFLNRMYKNLKRHHGEEVITQ